MPRPVLAQPDFRPDLQGLRAIAVTMVVLYHLYPSALPGGFAGVDVFFVVSGYLITGHLLRTFERTGRIGLTEFWGRRARRLVPAAVLVLLVTWLVSRLVLPLTRLPDAATQIRASALYVQNWVLARDAVNYLKSDDAASPVQHYWSLSVEEQFYLLWPILFVAVALLTRRWSRRVGRAGLLAMALAVVLASWTYSAYYTSVDPAAAYFATTTRIWELAVGGVLALLPVRLGLLLGRQGWLAWAGLAVVVASAFLLSGTSAYPGTLALLPVGGAALLIAAGSERARWGPARCTSLPPMVFLGGISYSLYLWHWPIIVLWTAWSGRPVHGLDGPAIIVAAVLLAWGTKVFVEDRVRLAPFIADHRGRSLATALVAIVPVALVTLYIGAEPAQFHGQLGPAHPGAAVLAGDVTSVPKVAPLPPLATAGKDLPAYETQHCEVGEHATTATTCTYGDTTNPTLTIALVGDSIAGEWFPALDEIAVAQHWKLVTEVHSTCPWTATMTIDPSNGTPYTACQTWGANVLHDLLSAVAPDVVLTSDRAGLATVAHPTAGTAALADVGNGMATYWRQLLAHGIGVVPIQETPEMFQSVPDCLSARHASVQSCSVEASKAITADPPTVVATRALQGAVDLVDMNPYICAPTECAPVVGNVVVYRDSHHLTNTYSLTLEPYLQSKILATVAFAS